MIKPQYALPRRQENWPILPQAGHPNTALQDCQRNFPAHTIPDGIFNNHLQNKGGKVFHICLSYSIIGLSISGKS